MIGASTQHFTQIRRRDTHKSRPLVLLFLPTNPGIIPSCMRAYRIAACASQQPEPDIIQPRLSKKYPLESRRRQVRRQCLARTSNARKSKDYNERREDRCPTPGSRAQMSWSSEGPECDAVRICRVMDGLRQQAPFLSLLSDCRHRMSVVAKDIGALCVN